MTDFNIRSDSIDVEQIMKQIRARIRDKRGVDYTEDQIRELATVRLERFLDPKNLRSDLLEQFRRSRPAIAPEPPPVEPPYVFDDQTLFQSHRGLLRFLRQLFKPVLKLFFNPNTLNQILYTQAQFNVDLLKREQRRKIEFDRSRAEWNSLYYEVLHNLVLETTRSGIEIKNLKMRLDSLAGRLDFSERRVRALEGVVQYRPEAVRSRDRRRDEVATEEGAPAEASAAPGAPAAAGESAGRRRRRRRRGRRGAGPLGIAGPSAGQASEVAGGAEALDENDADAEDNEAFEATGAEDDVSTLGESQEGEASSEPEMPIDEDEPDSDDPSTE